MAISGIEQRYGDFFEGPLRILVATHQLDSLKRGEGGRWHGFDSGHSGVIYRIAFLKGTTPSVRIVIDSNDRTWNQRLFHRLEERRRAIEAEIGAPLEWDYKEGRRRCIIYTVGDGDIADPRGTWVGMQDWMVDTLLAFRRVFGPRLAELVE